MPKLISLYTGAGGLDLGFEAAGFETAVAVEMDKEAATTLRHNRKWPVIDQDIHTVSSQELLDTASLQVGDADALIGGPPCQPFSKSGYWASGDTLRLDDPRAGTMAAYLRVLRDTLPKIFLLENVPGLAYREKSEGLELIEATIRKINRQHGTKYRIKVAKLNAADYGVPQLRERVFVVGDRDGSDFSFPTPTHMPTNGEQLYLGLESHITSWDAIGDLEDDNDPALCLKGKWADLLPTIPEGENYLWHTNRGGGKPIFGWRRRYWAFLLKLSKNLPSWTIQAHPGPSAGPFHWKNRRLSKRELCRLQSFPDEFVIIGSIASAQRQIGNAVPPALAAILGCSIRRQLLGNFVDFPNSLIPIRRLPVPPPEPVRRLPKRYKEMIGEHKPHPGTGQGPGAQRRKSPNHQAIP